MKAMPLCLLFLLLSLIQVIRVESLGTTEPSALPSAEPSAMPYAEPSATPSSEPSVAPTFPYCEIVSVNYGNVTSGFTIHWFVVSQSVYDTYVTSPNDFNEWKSIPSDELLQSGTSDSFSEEICLPPTTYYVAAFKTSTITQSVKSPSIECTPFYFEIGDFSGTFDVCDGIPAFFSKTIGDGECPNGLFAYNVQFNFSSRTNTLGWLVFQSGFPNVTVAQGGGQTDQIICVENDVHIVRFLEIGNSAGNYSVDYTLGLECETDSFRSGSISQASNGSFLLFDLGFETCPETFFEVEGLVLYGSNASDFGFQVTQFDSIDSSFELLAVSHGLGSRTCLRCGTFVLEVFNCLEGGLGSEFQVFLDGDVYASFNEFSLASSVAMTLPCPTRAPTIAVDIECGSEEAMVEFIIDYDSNPEETVWSIVELEGEDQTASLVSRGGYTDSLENQMCLKCNGTFILSLIDCGGDGICCSQGFGQYLLMQDNSKIIAQGGDFGYSERHFFNISCEF